MAQIYHIHPDSPQQRLLNQTVDVLQKGGVIAMPTDCCYVLACGIGDKSAMDRLRQIRQINEKHLLTLICPDLAQVSLFARVDNTQYRFLKAATPGAYTFILEASKELPRRIASPKRKTIGMRVPDYVLIESLLHTLGEPLISSSLILPGETEPLTAADEIADAIGTRIDLIIDSGAIGTGVTTVLDLTTPQYEIIRQGLGPTESLGLSEF